jgi:prephenate dehydratase
MKIGVMGAKGSFSEEAAQKYIEKDHIENAEIEYLVTAERVLSSIEAGEIDLGIFPIENSNGGIVIEAVYAMATHRFQVKKMFEIDVHQNLLVLPGTTASEIKVITSHDQAIKQCRMYLKRVWPEADITAYADTAKAAEDLANGTLAPTTAVIASKNAAKLYGLEVLEESVQDLKFNYTSFVVAEQLKPAE